MTWWRGRGCGRVLWKRLAINLSVRLTLISGAFPKLHLWLCCKNTKLWFEFVQHRICIPKILFLCITNLVHNLHKCITHLTTHNSPDLQGNKNRGLQCEAAGPFDLTGGLPWTKPRISPGSPLPWTSVGTLFGCISPAVDKQHQFCHDYLTLDEQLVDPAVMRSWRCLLLLYLAYRRNKEKASGARSFLCLWYTKIQSRSTGRRGCTNFCVCDFLHLNQQTLAWFKCICDGFSENYVYHKHKFNFGNAPIGTLVKA